MVTGSPKRSWTPRRNAAGRAIHATVCQAAGARGPGGKPIGSAYARRSCRLPWAAQEETMRRKALLGCGIVSSLVYVAANVLGARRWRDYSLTSQTVSELSAIGAPSRPLVVPLLTAHGA